MRESEKSLCFGARVPIRRTAPEHPVVRLSVSLGEDRRRRGTKSSPVRVKVSPPIPLSSAQTDGARARAVSPPVAVPWEMDAQKFSFRIYAAQSVRLFGYCSPTLCRCARAVLCGNFAPFCNRVSGGKRLRLPSPSQMLEQSGNSWGNFASLARSPLQAEWHRPNMCVRIQFPLTFSSV